MSDSLAKLSSGYRINKAADDAAGLAISEGLRSQIGGLKVAGRNTQDAINVVQTADGALNESTSILQRMRDLSVQASNDGGLDANAKSDIQTEMNQLKSELDRISNTTTFNGRNLLDGSYTGVFQVGANAGETISVAINQTMNASGLGVDGVDVTKAASDAMSGTVVNATANGTTGTASTFTTGAGDLATDNTNNGKLNGTISYGGKSLDLSTLTAKDSTAGLADSTSGNLADLQSQVNAVFGFEADGTTPAVAVTADGSGNLVFTGQTPGATDDAGKLAAESFSYAKVTGASDAITKIDAAITSVSTVRANLGAYQNRFEHTVNNINVAVENLSASESSIRDTDMASEMVNFTRTQILSQAGTAMLAQANQIPSGVLKLLG